MSDIRNWSKEFLTEFISIYREQPCLWKIKDKKVYTNRNLKTMAYEKLANFAQTVYSDANKTWVVQRVQSLRGSFRKEFNKWNETRNKTGSSTDSVHVPSLWYYNQLLFTKEQETPEESISNLSDDENNDAMMSTNIHDSTLPEEVNKQLNSEMPLQETFDSSKQHVTTVPSKKRKKDDSLHFAKTITEAINNCKDIDEFEAFGICVTAKTRKMNQVQYLIAESLINTVLSKGLLNTLTPDIGLQNNIDHSNNHYYFPKTSSTNETSTYPVINPGTYVSSHSKPISPLSYTYSAAPMDPMHFTETQVTNQNMVNDMPNSQWNYDDAKVSDESALDFSNSCSYTNI